MYPTDLKHGTIKINPLVSNHNIMLKTIQNLCYKTNVNAFNMTSPFLVDNILHQHKTVNFHNQFLNQHLESYRQSYSRENSPEVDEPRMMEHDEENRTDEIEKVEDEDSKSRDEDYHVKNDNIFYSHDLYNRNDDRTSEKEVLNIPNLSRRCHCGSFDCPPFACKKSGIRRLEELEKRFNLHSYQENSGDEGEKEKTTEDLVRNCEDYTEQKKPLLKFSVSAILGDQERDTVKSNIGK